MDEAGAGRHGLADWDGRWHLMVSEPVPSRASRERVRAGLAFLGYAQLWPSPPGCSFARTAEELRPAADRFVDACLAAAG